MAKKFITHDGHTVLGIEYVWCCLKTGKELNNSQCKPVRIQASLHTTEVYNDHLFFLTETACQAYIDKMNQPIKFKTHDGVDMRVGDTYWVVFENGKDENNKKDIPESNIVTPEFDIEKDFTLVYDILRFSSEEKAQEYLDSLNESKTVDQIGTDYTGKPIYEGHEIYCCWNLNNQPNITVQTNTIIATKKAISNTKDYCYFVHREECEQYIQAAKALIDVDDEFLKHVNVKIEPAESKSELEIAYDKLTALCAKYRPKDRVSVSIDVIQTYPSMVKKYKIQTASLGSFYISGTSDSLDDLIVLFHARLIQKN